DALRMYDGLTLDLEDRYHLVGIYATALLKCRDLLEEHPDDRDARTQMDYVLGWKKVTQESVAQLQQLAAAAPQDRRPQGRGGEGDAVEGRLRGRRAALRGGAGGRLRPAGAVARLHRRRLQLGGEVDDGPGPARGTHSRPLGRGGDQGGVPVAAGVGAAPLEA